PPVGDEVELLAAFELELLDELARLSRPRGELAKCRNFDLDVEMARVGQDRAVLHSLHVLAGDDGLVARGGAEDVTGLDRLAHRLHREAVHRRLERAQRIDLGDDHVRAHPTCAEGDPLAYPTVTADDESRTGEQHVRGADDSVDRRLPRPVAVVEHVLRVRVVDGNYRKAERPVTLERLQANDAGRRLLHAAEDVAELLAAMRVE